MSHDHVEPSPTIVDVGALLDQPGASRPVELDVPVPALFEVPLTAFAGEVAIEGVLESLVDGVLLRGTVGVAVDQTCARCLGPVATARVVADVAELFSDPATAEDPADVEEGYVIRDEQIDIDALIRDALAHATAIAPLCHAACRGLCPSCGSDLNATTCDCRDEVVDDRWAALADLKLNP
jgi:uncharacterized protein